MKARLIRRTGWFVLAVGAATAAPLPGCGSEDTKKGCETGEEGCACFSNDTCAAGLSCHSKLCVAVGNEQGTGGAANAQGGGTANGNGGGGQVGDAGGGSKNEGGEVSTSGGIGTNGGSSASTGGTSTRGGASDSGEGGAPDPGQGGAGATQGGTTAQGGKAQGGKAQGGAAPGTGGVITGTGGVSNEVSDPHIIDNFSSCNNTIARVAGRDGSWYTFGDNDVNLTPNTQGANPAPAVSSPPTAFSSSACAAWVTGGCAVTADACTYAGNGFTFRADSGPYDISAYTGVQFDYEGDQLWVAVTTSSGYAFGTIIAASSAARRTRSFNFADLMPAAETPPGTPLDLTRIRQIEFTTTKPSGFGQAIWDVRFF